MDDNESGGLPEEVQARIRSAAYDAVLAWAAGTPIAVPAPRGKQLVELLAVAQGEEVPAEFEPMMAEMLGFAAAPEPASRRCAGLPRHRRGGGVGDAGRLAAAFGRGPVTVLEKNEDVGGTWLENRYPGAGVDTPSHLYSFSFFDARLVDALRAARRGRAVPARLRRPLRPAAPDPVRGRGRPGRWDDDAQQWTVVTTAAGNGCAPTRSSAPSVS